MHDWIAAGVRDSCPFHDIVAGMGQADGFREKTQVRVGANKFVGK